jgi:hypothetical protein
MGNELRDIDGHLVHSDVQPAAPSGAVTYSPEQVAAVMGAISREVWDWSGVELSDVTLENAAHSAIQEFLQHQSGDRTSVSANARSE